MEDVLSIVRPLAANWRFLFSKLGIQDTVLDFIEQQNHGHLELCLYNAVGEWLLVTFDQITYGRQCWRTLARVVHAMDSELFEKVTRTPL